MIASVEEAPDARRLDAQLFSDLWVFRAAARLGSFTLAGQRLGVSQGAISQRVSRLEARLGTPLFLRHKGRIALTENGKSLLGAMTQVASILNDNLSRIEGVQRKAIVVSCVPSLATEWLVPHLEEFYSVHPGIEVFVRSEMFPSTPERLEDDGVDLVIDYQPEAPVGLEQLSLVQEFVFPVCSPGYRDRLRGGLAPVLLQDDLSYWDAAADFEWSSWRASAKSDWPGSPSAIRHFNLAHLTYHAAMCGQGVALGRAVLVNRLLNSGQLVLAIDGPPVPGSFYRILTTRPGKANSPIRRFAKWCGEAMTKTQATTIALVDSKILPPE